MIEIKYSSLTQEQIRQYNSIVREELEKYDLYWDHINSKSRLRRITEARWAIIHRLKTEMDCNQYQISKMLELDYTTVKNALRKMAGKGVTYFEDKPVCEETAVRTKRKLNKWSDSTC